jgi:ER lumen protein retaining receptor
MACLGCYKIFYIMSWVYQLLQNQNLVWIKFVAGIVQIAIFLDFLYYYFVSAKVSPGTLKLPV